MSNSSCDEKTAKLIEEQSKKYNALMNTDENHQILTKFLEQTAEILTCGPECKKTKSSNEYLAKYQQAQMALFNGTDDLEDTSKTYYTFAEGDEYARKFSEEKLRDVANKIGDTYLEVFDDIVQSSYSLNNLYETNTMNYENSKKLASEYDSQNKLATTELKDTRNIATTSDRKTYYENQELDGLKTRYSLYYYVYIIIVAVFAISMFTVKTTTPFRRQTIILGTLVLWFFFGPHIITWLIGAIKSIIALIPKNVYLTL